MELHRTHTLCALNTVIEILAALQMPAALAHQVSIVVGVTTHLPISEHVCAPRAPVIPRGHTSASKETGVALNLG